MQKTLILFLLVFTSCSLFEKKTIYNSDINYTAGTKRKKSALILINEGRFEIEEENFNEAKRKFEKSIQIDRNNPYSYFFLGVISLKEKKSEKAKGYFQRSLSLFSSTKENNFWLAHAYKNLGISHYLLNQEQKAHDYFEKALSFDSSDSETKEYLELLRP